MAAPPVREGATRHGTRVAAVLTAFLDHPDGLSITEVAARMDVSKSVVHRVLTALAERDVVQQDDDNRYRLGAAGRSLALAGLRHSTLLRGAMPLLRQLHAETGETTTVAARVWDRRVHLDQLLSPHHIRMGVELGRGFPLHAGATGKAILAFAPDEVREHVLSTPLAPVTDRTTRDPDVLRAELAQIRLDRVATSVGERQPDARSVAAPVLDAVGIAVGALTVCGPASRFSTAIAERLRGRVRDAATVVGMSRTTVSRP